MSEKERISRRAFLRLSASSAVAVAIAACARPTPIVVEKQVPVEKVVKETVVVEKQVPVEKVVKETVVVEKKVEVEKVVVPKVYQEAPMLAELVKAGKLPPVDQRVSEEPLVVHPYERIGKYGGTWRRAFRGVSDFHAYGRCVYEQILRWPRNPKDPVRPGIAKQWEFSGDGKELTLYLRKGMKWSDGHPFTVDDIIFWWEDIELNKDITPAIHSEWVVKGQPMTLEKLDDYRIKLKFVGPNGLVLRMLAFHGNQWPLAFERFGFFAPKHYLTQFLPKYNKDIKDYKVFEEKAYDLNPERPTVNAWPVSEWGAGATRLVATRNPYYWKVDPEGRQLPYIDKIDLALVEDNEVINLKAIQGEIDMQTRGLDIKKYSLMRENADKYGYNVYLWTSASGTHLALWPNQSYDKDPVLQKLFQTKNFRIALSIAINRDRINEIAYLGLGEARGETVVPESAFYIPELEKANVEYDPEKAKKLLDELGLKVGPDGIRLRPDGQPLEVIIETNRTGAELDPLELIADDWKAIGVKATIKSMERSLYWTRATGNEVQIATWGTDRGLEPFVDPIYQFPFDERSWMAPAYGTWYKSEGKLGSPPTPEMKKAMDLFDEFRNTVDQAKQIELGKAIVRLSTEECWTIQTVGMVPSPVVVKKNFYNVPQKNVADWIFMTPGNLDPEHFWMDV